MQSPSKACYAIIAALDLALAPGDSATTRGEIAGRHGLSDTYLSHILLRLRRAGIVSSLPGRRGGYFLARAPGEISLAEVLDAVGEDASLRTCPSTYAVGCRCLATCQLRPVWLRLAEQTRESLRSLSLVAPLVAAGGDVGEPADARAPAEAVSGCQDALGRPLTEAVRESLADGAAVDRTSPVPAALSAPTGATMVVGGGPATAGVVDLVPIHTVDGSAMEEVVRSESARERDGADDEMLRVNRLESLSAMVAGAAHGLADLLTGVAGGVSLARCALDADTSAVQVLAEAEDAARQAQELVRQLLALANGRPEVSVAAALQPLLSVTMAAVLAGSGCHGRAEVAPGTSSVRAAQAEVAQVLQSLIANAREATPAGGTVSVSAQDVVVAQGEVGGLQPGAYVRLVVADRDDGVAGPMRSRPFEPRLSTMPGHSGPGLDGCRAIVRRRDGVITSESTPGEGTRVAVYLPAAGEPEVVAERAQPPPVRRRVLVMDDSDAVRVVTSRMLERLGYSAVTAGDGEAAISAYSRAMAEGCPFEAVLLDERVPSGLGGVAAFARLRELDPDVRGLVVTEYGDGDLARGHRSHGFRAALPKPFCMAELREAMAGLVEP